MTTNYQCKQNTLRVTRYLKNIFYKNSILYSNVFEIIK